MKYSFLMFVVLTLPLIAQLPDETNGRVPELDAFHKPIYTLWHDAWPAKDITALKQLYPSVDSAFNVLSSAVLPGILRDKQGLWDSKKIELQNAVKEYAVGIAGSDSARILSATEKVHFIYEQIVRIVRPVTPQLDAFHRILYSIHHYYIPEKDREKIVSSVRELAAAMDSLDRAPLPARWARKNALYEQRKKILSDGVRDYVSAVTTNMPMEKIEQRERAVHGRYQMVEKVFE